jgi:hypothetical protein
MSQNNFILHGHFYQPPRENPWTGFMDRQKSAYPYNDWNIRINTECYAACTRTPIVENNEIIKIVNCFEYLSYPVWIIFIPLNRWRAYYDLLILQLIPTTSSSWAPICLTSVCPM